MFFGMVVQQAAEIVVEGNSVVFAFLPTHKSSRSDLERKRAWLEQLAEAASGRKIAVIAREATPPPAAPKADANAPHQKELRDRAKADPGVQAVLDVFGGDVEDVEEIN
jgi:hypothetical protein